MLLITLIYIPIKYPGGFILYILIIKDKQITDTETGFNMIDLYSTENDDNSVSIVLEGTTKRFNTN